MLKIILDHLLLLIFAPAKGWKRIVRENKPEAVIRSNFVFPLIGLVALSSFLGLVFTEGLQIALKAACVSFVSYFMSFFVTSFLVNEIVPRFGIEKNMPRMQIFVGFSSCILYVLNIIIELRFLPEFFFLQIFVLYTLYVVWESVGTYFKEITEEVRTPFTLLLSFLILLSPILIKKVLCFLMPGI